MLSSQAKNYFDTILPKESGGIFHLLKDLVEYKTQINNRWVWSQSQDEAEEHVEALMDFLDKASSIAEEEQELFS